MSILKDSPDFCADSEISEEDQLFFCFYKNNTPHVQVLRLLESHEYWERVIFPQERLLFEARPNSQLEVQMSLDLHDLIPCIHLKIN